MRRKDYKPRSSKFQNTFDLDPDVLTAAKMRAAYHRLKLITVSPSGWIVHPKDVPTFVQVFGSHTTLCSEWEGDVSDADEGMPCIQCGKPPAEHQSVHDEVIGIDLAEIEAKVIASLETWGGNDGF